MKSQVGKFTDKFQVAINHYKQNYCTHLPMQLYLTLSQIRPILMNLFAMLLIFTIQNLVLNMSTMPRNKNEICWLKTFTITQKKTHIIYHYKSAHIFFLVINFWDKKYM